MRSASRAPVSPGSAAVEPAIVDVGHDTDDDRLRASVGHRHNLTGHGLEGSPGQKRLAKAR